MDPIPPSAWNVINKMLNGLQSDISFGAAKKFTDMALNNAL